MGCARPKSKFFVASRLCYIWLLVTAVPLCNVDLQSQQQAAKVTGTVATSTGEIPDVITVRVLDTKTHRCIKEVSTSPGGQFSMNYLAANTYDLVACSKPMYKRAWKKGLILDWGEEDRISPPLILIPQHDLIELEGPIPNDSIDTVVCLVDRTAGCILGHTRSQRKSFDKKSPDYERRIYKFSGVANDSEIGVFPAFTAGISDEEATRRKTSTDDSDYALCVKAVPKEKQCP